MKEKYPSLEALGAKLHAEEPWFVVRAQDIFAPAAVMAYATISKQHKELHPLIDAMLAWQKNNPSLVKKPD